MIEDLKKFTEIFSWEVVVLVLAISFRKQFAGVIDILKSRMSTAENIEITKEGIKIKQKLAQLEDAVTGAINSGQMGLPPKATRTDVHPESQVENDSDPLKHSWEGNLKDRNRSVFAEVHPLEGTNYYQLRIVVRSTDPNRDPLKGKVKFHLHPSFPNPHPEIEVKDGEAVLSLISYGSFTLGAETEDGAKLKIDLAQDVPSVTEQFKNA